MNGPVTARVRPVPHPLRPVPECDRARRHGTLDGEVRTGGLSEPGRRMTTGGKVHRGLLRTAGAGSAAAAAWLWTWTIRRPPATVRDVDHANPRRVIELRDCVLALQPGAAASPAPNLTRQDAGTQACPPARSRVPQRPGRLQRRPTLPGSVRSAPPTFSPERAAGKGDLGRGRCTAEVNGSGLRPGRHQAAGTFALQRVHVDAVTDRPASLVWGAGLSGGRGDQSVLPPATCCGRSTLRSPG